MIDFKQTSQTSFIRTMFRQIMSV